MSQTGSAPTLYAHPFSKAYWKQAASEFKKTKVLIFAALMIALAVIAAVIVYKTREYAAGNAFYDSLRGMR